MNIRSTRNWTVPFLAAATLLSAMLPTYLFADETTAASPPKLSPFAPAKDLQEYYDKNVAELERGVASPETFKDQPAGRFERDANRLSLVVIALGVHDEPNPEKAFATPALKALKHLAAAKDYEATKTAVAELASAATSKTGGEVQWAKAIPLNDMMRDYVPRSTTSIGNDVRKLSKRSKQVVAEAAFLALMAENAKLYSDEVATKETEKKWMSCCDSMRDAAALVAVKARACDKTGTAGAMEKLNHTCHDCHAVFNPDK